MRVTCPHCAHSYPVSAGFAEDDGKRLAALFADMEPVLGRAVIGYLRLFKPPKTALRSARALRIVEDLLVLVRSGTVCRDERGGIRRPAPPAVWAAGIEQLLVAPEKLRLPLANHHYLRAVVFGLADQADASAERAREQSARGRRRTGADQIGLEETRLDAHLGWLRQQLSYGQITKDEHDRQAAEARARHGESEPV